MSAPLSADCSGASQPAFRGSAKTSKLTWLPWLGLLVFAVAVYALGLDGQYVPSNGDELVYSHIARLTAASGHWLPLVSDLEHMRNTKPPLLFWQAMLAGGWGRNWSMAALRAPSVIYTLAIAALLGYSLQRITCDLRRGLLGACIYLAFFCTFRYGRTFLTSAPETFWLNLPMFYLLRWQLRDAHQRASAVPTLAANGQAVSERRAGPGWLAHTAFGLFMGLGLAYKSFALIVPAAATLCCAQLFSAPTFKLHAVLPISLQVAWSAALALAVFALWFVLDPDPAAVWQEFVVGENAGKMVSAAGYWRTALAGGGSSIWAQMLAYALNAGLLVFVVLGLMALGLRQSWSAWRSKRANLRAPNQCGELSLSLPLDCAATAPSRQALTQAQRLARQLLLLWLAIWLLIFMLPSQRSARYLIDAMPALAMLLTLYWRRIARGWFMLSLTLCGVFIGVFARIAWSAYQLGIGSQAELITTELAAAGSLLLIAAGLAKTGWTRACTVAAALGVFAVFGLTTAPLNGAAGRYAVPTMAALSSQRIAVPSSFNAQFERFLFLLPGNRFIPYDGDALAAQSSAVNRAKLAHLLHSHDAVVWLQTPAEAQAPMCLPGCTVLAQRWEIKGRHQSGEINWGNFWQPQQWLFRREWLLRLK